MSDVPEEIQLTTTVSAKIYLTSPAMMVAHGDFGQRHHVRIGLIGDQVKATVVLTIKEANDLIAQLRKVVDLHEP